MWDTVGQRKEAVPFRLPFPRHQVMVVDCLGIHREGGLCRGVEPYGSYIRGLALR